MICSICGYEHINTTTPATGHKEVIDAAVGATCTTTGLTEGKHCEVCGEVIVAQTVVCMIPHVVVVIPATAPTCTETGLTAGAKCDVCGTILAAQETVAATGHDYDAVVTAPTCTEKGYTTYTCSVCGDSYVADEVPATGKHNLSVVVTQPTCTEPGAIVSTCTVCGMVTTHDTAPAKGHKEVVDAAVDATCTTTGLTEGKHCSVCGEILVKQDVVPMIPHTEGAIVVENNVAPDCTNDGSYDNVVYCTVCGVELSRDTVTVDKLGHKEVVDAAVDATCTTTGLTEGKHCEVCGEVTVAQNETAKIDHKTTSKTVDATCESIGYTIVTCVDCSEILSITQIAAKGHNYVDGVCTVCQEVGEAVATIDGVKYATLEKAIEAAKNGDVIELLANVMLDDRITIDKTITIDLNGKKISASSTVFTVAAQGVLTLTNGTIDGFNQSNGTILNAGGTLILNDGMAVNTQLNIRNISILHRAGTLVVNGGTYLNKVTIGDTATIYDGTFSGIIEVTNPGDLTIYGGTFAQDVTDWCADGYHSVDPDGDGMYVVEKHNYVFDKHVDPTCTEAGYTTYKCVCGLVEQKDHVAATGHTNVVVVNGKAPTCTDPGLTAGLKCNDCGKMLQAQDEIPMLEAVVQLEVYDANTGITTITEYATIAEAIEAGKKGDTIKLLKDLEEENVSVINNVIFDLNGHTLTVTYFAAFPDAQVIDSNANKTGLLVVAPNRIELPENNLWMPVYTGAGYKFFDVTMNSKVEQRNEINGFAVKFRPSLGSTEFNTAYLGEGSDAAHLTIKILLTWTNSAGRLVTQVFEISDGLVKEAYANGSKNTMELEFANVVDHPVISATLILESDTGVTVHGTTMNYTPVTTTPPTTTDVAAS